MRITPFTVAIGDDQLLDLDRRLQHTRWPDASPAHDWEDGTDLAFMQRLTQFWRTEFDWRAQEAKLNELPQYIAELDGLATHFVHQPGSGPSPYPLLIGHGWPGTGFDLRRIIPFLADPGRHGADPADAFDVIVPSLPGYGFSQRPDRPGVGPERVAGMWAELMTALGYGRFGVQSGDWGGLKPKAATTACSPPSPKQPPTRSPTPQLAWRPGSLRRCAAGATVMAPSSRCSAWTTY